MPCEEKRRRDFEKKGRSTVISILSALFIRDRANFTDPDVRQKYGMLCGAAGIALNLLLFAGKFVAGILSHSIAVTADAVNNLSDAGSSVITLIGFKLAGQAPDPDHPFGHGRIEYISGLAVSFLIILMGVELLKSSVDKILHPAPVEGSALVLAILAASIAVKIYMYCYNRSIGKKIDSAAMKATAMDSLSDSAATLAVLAATLVGHFTDLMIDGWCGILVAAFILYSGISAARETISPLLGQAPDEEFVKKIEEIVLSHEQVQGMHDLMVHNYGPGRTMISLHAEVPAHGDILALHDTIDNIEGDLRRELKCDAVIHMDPIVTDDPAVQALKTQVEGELHRIDPSLSLHDFRLVTGPTHTNVIFDMEVPASLKNQEKALKKQVEQGLTQANGETYYAVITFDQGAFQ